MGGRSVYGRTRNQRDGQEVLRVKSDEVLWLLERILVGTWGVSGRRSVSLGAKKHVKKKANAVGASENQRNATIFSRVFGVAVNA
jgi:hypothetical protein